MKHLIIGGVAGGATAAARIRRNDETADIVLVERGPYISFANCGLPYHLSGTIAERERLLVTSEAAFSKRYAVTVKSGTEALAIDRAAHTVRLRDLASGNEYDERYDRLLLSPGAAPVRPPLPGLDDPRVFSLRNLPDLDNLMAYLQDAAPKRAVVVGGGFIGIEAAENLHQRGLCTSLVEGGDQLLAPLDPEMAAIVQTHLRERGLGLYLGERIERIDAGNDHCTVVLQGGQRLPADLVLLAIGVRPEAELARAAGLTLGVSGGIRVDACLQTSDPAIWAVGDAIEVSHTVDGRPALIPLAGPANRQGRMAADNMVFGNRERYAGTQATSIIKVFDYAAATTGLNEKQLKSAGIDYRATITHGMSHAGYYPGAQPLSIKLLYAPDGKLLGAQAVGTGGVDKRIDVIATALAAGRTVTDLSRLELAYAPPFGSAKDPVNVAGHVAGNVLDGSHRIIDWQTLAGLPAGAVQLVDVRTPQEFTLGTIAGARNIELDTLRERLAELDPTRPVVVFCQVGLRGYLACRILAQRGFADVRNLTGGYKTWSLATGQPDTTDPAGFDEHEPRAALPAAPAAAPDPADRTLDATGLQCPGPIVQTAREMADMPVGGVLTVTASDPAFGRDVRAWAQHTGNQLMAVETVQGSVVARLRKGAPLAVPSGCRVAAANGKTTLVVFSADLDKVMASLIIANGALAMGQQVSVFFTFWGLNVLRRSRAPAVHKPLLERMFGWMMPRGVERLDSISRMNFGGLGARLIRKVMQDKQVDLPAKLLCDLAAGGAQLIACRMSMDVMGIRPEELIDGVELGGVATFLGEARDSTTSLFI